MKVVVFCAAFCLQFLTSAPTWADGRGFDPEISFNGLFLGGYTKREDPDGAPTSRTGLYTQQMEVHATARVDSNTKAEFAVFLFPSRGDKGGWSAQGVGIAEGFITTRLSDGLLLKAGKFYAAFGRHNLLHAHQFPFLDPPLVLERLFGEGGIDEVGLGVRWSLPVPWRAALDVQAVNGDNPLWVNPTDEDLLYLGHLENQWDLGDAALELGGSWAGGRNVRERYTNALGADLTLRWRSGERARPRALTWQTEYVYATEDMKVERRKRGGMYSFLQYQFARRWWAQARYDYYGLPQEGSAGGWEDRYSVLLAFVRNPRFPLRFQYSRWRMEETGRGYNQYHIQLNFSIGRHPAHGYGAASVD